MSDAAVQNTQADRPPYTRVTPELARQIEDVREELYMSIDEGIDPGPLTEKLSKLKKAAGLVEEADEEDGADGVEPPDEPATGVEGTNDEK